MQCFSFKNFRVIFFSKHLWWFLFCFSCWKCKSECDLFSWTGNGGHSPMSFTSWKFQGALFQFGIRKRIFPKCILVPPQAPKYCILIPLDQCWNRDLREGGNLKMLIRPSAWTLSYLKCLSNLSLPVATSLLPLLYCILCHRHCFSLFSSFSLWIPSCPYTCSEGIPPTVQWTESRMSAEPLDTFLTCCGKGSPCWARSWFYFSRKSQESTTFVSKRKGGVSIYEEWLETGMWHSDPSWLWVPSIHNKVMCTTWTCI